MTSLVVGVSAVWSGESGCGLPSYCVPLWDGLQWLHWSGMEAICSVLAGQTTQGTVDSLPIIWYYSLILFSLTPLDFKLNFLSYCCSISVKAEVDHLKRLFEKYIEGTLNFKKDNCMELIPITELNGVTSLCHLYDSLATSSNGVSEMKYNLIITPAKNTYCQEHFKSWT